MKKESKMNFMSSSCLTRRSTKSNTDGFPVKRGMTEEITRGMTKRTESGRSMVEMLGVLAIVGVLSVGGVYGYGVAMKKHKANELLHQASMLATTISAQIMSGKEPTALDTFGDSDLGKFALDYDPTKTTFDLKISEMDGSVCSQLKEGGMVQKVECNPDAKTATLTYYKNLATTEAEGEKSPTGNDVECSSDSNCKSGCQKCLNGKCESTCKSGQYCAGSIDSYYDYTCLDINKTSCSDENPCEYTGCCLNGICVIPDCGTGFWQAGPPDGAYGCFDEDYNNTGNCSGDIKGCTTNSDCETDEYCAIYASSCYTLQAGKCLPIGTSHTVAKITEEDGFEYNGWIYSSKPMTWWSADNWCKAQGKHLVNLSELGCKFEEEEDIDSDGDTDGFCSNWTGLQAAFGTNSFYWTSERYDPCYSFRIAPNDTIISYTDNDFPDLDRALCN